MTLSRFLLLSAPALLPAGLLGGAGASALTLGLWTAVLCRREQSRPALYPRQRRRRPARFALGWAAGCLFPAAAERLLRAAQSAAPFRAGFPAWAGAAFFAAVCCRRFVMLPVGRRTAFFLTAAFCALSLALYRL